MAVYLLVGVSAYSRPSSLLAARQCDLVPPAPGRGKCWSLLQHPEEGWVASKTQLYDEGCLLDSPYLHNLVPLFHKMASPSRQSLWNFTYPELAAELRATAAELGLGVVTPYQMRHSGASIDVLRRWRPLGGKFEEGGLGHRPKAWTGLSSAQGCRPTTRSTRATSGPSSNSASSTWRPSCSITLTLYTYDCLCTRAQTRAPQDQWAHHAGTTHKLRHKGGT